MHQKKVTQHSENTGLKTIERDMHKETKHTDFSFFTGEAERTNNKI